MPSQMLIKVSDLSKPFIYESLVSFHDRPKDDVKFRLPTITSEKSVSDYSRAVVPKGVKSPSAASSSHFTKLNK